MPPGMSCPECGSANLRGGGMDLADGDELREIGCLVCHAGVEYLRSSALDVSAWYVDRSYPEAPAHRSLTGAADATERALLAEIHESPEDDGPRLIYADWLQDREDPLGTFIALQCGRTTPRPSHEETALLVAHWRSWIGAPSAVVSPYGLAFERGFWSACGVLTRYHEGYASGSPLLASPSWSTVRRLVLFRGHDALAPELLTSRLARSLVELAIESPTLLAKLATWTGPPLALRELVYVHLEPTGPPLPTITGLTSLQRLRVLAHEDAYEVDWRAVAGPVPVTIQRATARYPTCVDWPSRPFACVLPRK